MMEQRQHAAVRTLRRAERGARGEVKISDGAPGP
jgi:hypothetical protein